VGDRFKKEEVKKGTFKIRDTENEKWVRDGNGRAIRMEDEDRVDNIEDIMEKRVKGEWHE
jgi:hypothetical protein